MTTNPEAALCHIRHTDKAVVIWADAICINQEDNVEKSYQVSMMKDIYKDYSQVYL